MKVTESPASWGRKGWEGHELCLQNEPERKAEEGLASREGQSGTEGVPN